jgi:hypothetical protein
MGKESYNNIETADDIIETPDSSRAEFDSNEMRFGQLTSEITRLIETGDDDAALSLIAERKRIKDDNAKKYEIAWDEADKMNEEFDAAQEKQNAMHEEALVMNEEYDNYEEQIQALEESIKDAMASGDDNRLEESLLQRKTLKAKRKELVEGTQLEDGDDKENPEITLDKERSSTEETSKQMEEIFGQMENVSSREELAELVLQLGAVNTVKPGFFTTNQFNSEYNAEKAAKLIREGYGINMSDSRIQPAAWRVQAIEEEATRAEKAGPMHEASIEGLKVLDELRNPSRRLPDGSSETIQELLANPDTRPSKEYATHLIGSAIGERNNIGSAHRGSNNISLESIRSLINDLEYDETRLKEKMAEEVIYLYGIKEGDMLPDILEAVGINAREFALEQLPKVFGRLMGSDDIMTKLQKFRTWRSVFGIQKTDPDYIAKAYSIWDKDVREHGSSSSFNDDALRQLFLGEKGWIWDQK